MALEKIAPADPGHPRDGLALLLRSPLGRIARYFAQDAWRKERTNQHGLRGAIDRAARVLFLAVRGFFTDKCLTRSASLTYITVLSLVPLLAFAFAVSKGLGIYDRLMTGSIEPFLDNTFGRVDSPSPMILAASEGTHEIRVAIDEVLGIVSRTDVKTLGSLGLVLLVLTILKLLGAIERSFNDIWGVQRSRSLVRKLTDYLAMVIVTPIFLIAATAFTAAAQSSGLVAWLDEKLSVGAVFDVVLGLVPLLALWVGFTFLYLAMPNTRTRWSSALIGALVASLAWQGMLLVHIHFQVMIAKYGAIYAGFAAIPVFLVWVNLSWVIILAGAELCFAHQSEPAYVHVAESRSNDHAFLELVGLRASTRIAASFLAGDGARTLADLVQDLGVPSRDVETVLDRLVRARVLVLAESESDPAYLPGRELASISVKEVLDALRGTTGLVAVPTEESVDYEIDRILAALDAEAARSRDNVSLRTLAEAAMARRAARPVSAGSTPRLRAASDSPRA